MAHVGVISWLRLCLTDILHDLVLAFTRYFVARQDNFNALPVNIFRDLLVDKVFELLSQPGHERRARRDTVAIECVLLWHLRALFDSLFTRLLRIQRRAKATSALLVHLSPGCYPVDSHEEQLLRLDLAKEMLNVVEDLDKHFIFRHTKGDGIRLIVSTIMDDAVHVKIQTVEFWDSILSNELRDRRVSLRHPSEELRDTHCSGGLQVSLMCA